MWGKKRAMDIKKKYKNATKMSVSFTFLKRMFSQWDAKLWTFKPVTFLSKQILDYYEYLNEAFPVLILPSHWQMHNCGSEGSTPTEIIGSQAWKIRISLVILCCNEETSYGIPSTLVPWRHKTQTTNNRFAWITAQSTLMNHRWTYSCCNPSLIKEMNT